MKIALFAVSLLLLTGNALADPQPWMRKDNPGELSVDTDVTEPCEISEQQLRETVEGVLTRSSITPIEFGESPVWLGLQVNVDCLGTSMFAIRVDFVDAIDLVAVRYGTLGYGSFGAHDGDSDVVLSGVTRQVERAIADYLIANFDP